MEPKKKKRRLIWLLLSFASVMVTILWWMVVQFYQDYRNTPSHHLIGNRPAMVAALKEQGLPFSFLVIGDPTGSERSETLIETALKNGDASFLIICGDFVRRPDIWNHRFFLTEITKEIKPPFPVFLIPGNHDIDYLSQKIKKRERRVTPEIYESLYGARNFDFVCNDCLFILCEVDWRRPSNYLNYLRDVLSEKSKEKRQIFLFIHYPPQGVADHTAFDLPNPEEFFSLLEVYHGVTCFSGHYHGYRRSERKGVNYIVTGGGGRLKKWLPAWGKFNHILRVTVDQNKVAEEILTIKEGIALEDRFEEWIFTGLFPIIQNFFWILYVIFVALVVGSGYSLLRLMITVRVNKRLCWKSLNGSEGGMRERESSLTNRKYGNSTQPIVWKSFRIENFLQLSSTPIPSPLTGGLVVVLAVVAYGLLLLHQDQQAFRIWIREDGLAEWLTFVVLLMMSVYSFAMRATFGHFEEERAARRVWLFFGFLFLFGAMEEISWGQRILSIDTPEWFIRHNAQGEINIHNLIICGVKLNKLVFGKILTLVLVIYLLLIPLIYRINERLKGAVQRLRFPVAQNYQILLFIGLAIVIRLRLGLSKHVEELLEFSGCYIIFLAVTHPYNHEIISLEKVRGIFRRGKKRDHEDIS